MNRSATSSRTVDAAVAVAGARWRGPEADAPRILPQSQEVPHARSDTDGSERLGAGRRSGRPGCIHPGASAAVRRRHHRRAGARRHRRRGPARRPRHPRRPCGGDRRTRRAAGAADHRCDGAGRRPGLHRSPHAFRDAAGRQRHRAEQGPPGRDPRRHRREHLSGAARSPRGAGPGRAHARLAHLQRVLRAPGKAGHLHQHDRACRLGAGAPGGDGLRHQAVDAGPAQADDRSGGALDGGRGVGPGDTVRERRA